jgi:hypothetical protein
MVAVVDAHRREEGRVVGRGQYNVHGRTCDVTDVALEAEFMTIEVSTMNK